MWKQKLGRRSTVVVAATLAGCVFAGVVVAGPFRGQAETQDRLQAAIDHDPLLEVARISASGGSASRGVFAQSTSAGFLCLWDAASSVSRDRVGGCNRAVDPFAGRKMMISFAYEGGPAIADVKDARLIGIVASDVTAVQVVMSDGSRRAMTLRTVPTSIGDFQAFGHRFAQGELRRGAAPTAVVALGRGGAEVDRQPTGF
jgi:hypothetical protein